MHSSACSLISLLALASATAAQGYITNFEAFTASATGTPMAGQDGFYIPAVAGSIDGAMYTYAGNPHGVPVNPNGGANFWAGASQGAAAPARSQRALTLPTGKIRIEYDVCCTYTGTVTPTNNIGSFSFQPSTNSIYVNLLAAWPTGVVAPPTTWDANVITRGVVPATVTTILPDPAFQNLPVGVWHRWGVTIDLVAGTHDEFSITNGSTNVTTTYAPPAATPLLLPVAPSLPGVLPTDFRLFGGGGLGNVFAIDNLVITYGAEVTSFGTGCAGSMGVPSLTASVLPKLGSTLTLNAGNLALNLGIMIAGTSDTLAGGSIPLPLDLTSFGWPGCSLLVDPIVTDTLLGTNNTASWTLSIPNVSIFLGFTIFNQVASLDPGPSSLAFSAGARCRIGL